MKASHRKIVALRRNGHWLDRDEHSPRGIYLVRRNGDPFYKSVCMVRAETIAEMRRIGLLEVRPIHGCTYLVPKQDQPEEEDR